MTMLNSGLKGLIVPRENMTFNFCFVDYKIDEGCTHITIMIGILHQSIV